MFCVAKVVGAWFVLMLFSTNLIGLVVRGLVTPLEGPDLGTSNAFLSGEVRKAKRADRILTLGSACVTVIYLYALLHYWHLGVAFAAVMFMASRIPTFCVRSAPARRSNRGTSRRVSCIG